MSLAPLGEAPPRRGGFGDCADRSRCRGQTARSLEFHRGYLGFRRGCPVPLRPEPRAPPSDHVLPSGPAPAALLLLSPDSLEQLAVNSEYIHHVRQRLPLKSLHLP